MHLHVDVLVYHDGVTVILKQGISCGANVGDAGASVSAARGARRFFTERAPARTACASSGAAGRTLRRLAEVRWHSRCARRARALDEKTPSPPRRPRVPLGGTTHGTTACRLRDQHAPAHPTSTGSGTSYKTPTVAFHQLAPGRPVPDTLRRAFRQWLENRLRPTRPGARELERRRRSGTSTQVKNYAVIKM